MNALTDQFMEEVVSLASNNDRHNGGENDE